MILSFRDSRLVVRMYFIDFSCSKRDWEDSEVQVLLFWDLIRDKRSLLKEDGIRLAVAQVIKAESIKPK